jgi:hypothetical protein
MERGALSISLLLLFVLFTIQFFVGMAQNLLVVLPMTSFPQNNSHFSKRFPTWQPAATCF